MYGKLPVLYTYIYRQALHFISRYWYTIIINNNGTIHKAIALSNISNRFYYYVK